MLRSYFKIAWRNISRSKGYSILNISGLAIGLAVALLIGLWVYYQYSYDRYLPDARQVYQVARNFNSNGDTLTFTSTSLKLAEVLRHSIPEMQYVAESDGGNGHGLMVGEKKLYLYGPQVASSYLNIFGFPLLEGNPNTALNDPYSIVLTQTTAKALFDNEDPMGKIVRLDNANNLKVTAILKDLPGNSTQQFSYLVPFSLLEIVSPYVRKQRQGSYGNNAYSIFVKLAPGHTFTDVRGKLRDIEHTETGNTNAMLSEVILKPMLHWHLYGDYKNGQENGGFVDYVRIFSIIGILVLLIACINFINLTTARSERRAREVGVRKAVGSPRSQLIIQFLTESLLLTAFAGACALVLVRLALPYFNSMCNCQIDVPIYSPSFWLVYSGGILFTALIAGARPAFYLSSFNTVRVLKGNSQRGKQSSLPRKILVVTQFSCSIALIISTFIVYQQIQYAKDRPTGYDVNRLVYTSGNQEISKNIVAFKNDLKQAGLIQNLTAATSNASNVNWHTDIDQWPGKHAGETVEMGAMFVGDDYFQTLNIPIAAGRSFENVSDTLSVVFNETAIKRLRLSNPVNQTIIYSGYKLRIIGVSKDALMVSPFSPPDPTMFLYDNANGGLNIMYRIAPHMGTQAAIEKIRKVYNQYSPSYPFQYDFADQIYAQKFNLEMLIGKLASIFAALAIFISCLGLLGLAAYMAESRTKEIGIRKVLGASVPQIWMMLSKDFIVLVLISCLLATPFAFYFLQHWLQQYNYRIRINPLVFVGAGIIALLVTLITVSVQSIRAAIAKPVDSLRTE